MTLLDLKPRWVGAGGPGITRDGQPVPERHGVGVSFDCPCGQCGIRCYVPFRNPLDGGPCHETRYDLWERTGNSFETLTIRPSIRRMDGCGWHGWITAGYVTSV